MQLRGPILSVVSHAQVTSCQFHHRTKSCHLVLAPIATITLALNILLCRCECSDSVRRQEAVVEEEGRMLAGGGHGHLCTPRQVGDCHED